MKAPRNLAELGDQRVTKHGNTTSFVYKSNVLNRKFIDVTPGSDVVMQVVVPSKFRNQVMKLAHESNFGGHLGNKKTRDRIQSNFFRPGMHADVGRYCRSCGPCQRTSLKGKATKVPLGSTPLIDEPFRRAALDWKDQPTSRSKLLHQPTSTPTESPHKAQTSPNPDKSRRGTIKPVLDENKDVLTDIPRLTTLGKRDIRQPSEGPTKNKPYSLPQIISEYLTISRIIADHLSRTPET